jgi:hypothetical protein
MAFLRTLSIVISVLLFALNARGSGVGLVRGAALWADA